MGAKATNAPNEISSAREARAESLFDRIDLEYSGIAEFPVQNRCAKVGEPVISPTEKSLAA
jgi:hypothetical protein